MVKRYKPVVLLILDGFGVSRTPNSTWKYAKMPAFREIEKFFPFTTLQASGTATGLPWGEEGNSEVGHLTIGAGRPIFHHLPRIIMSIHDGTFFTNKAFLDAAGCAKANNSKLHIAGIFSSGSVHAYVEHLYALLELAGKEGLKNVYLHLFTDGRDTQIKESAKFIQQLENRILALYPYAKIGSVSGRDFAMDRDENWARVEKTYKCMIGVCHNEFNEASKYIAESYEKEISDEFIEPAMLKGGEGKISSGDSLIFFNFREDSMRELASAFVADEFSGFARDKLSDIFTVTMTEYDGRMPARVAFPPLDVPWPLSRIISEAGLSQLHIAETEKYAHITYFFNGGKETPYKGEERILVPSPKTPKFDSAPEMSIGKITEEILKGLAKYDFILANFANGDMIGHTGNFDATVKAIEALDDAIAKIYPEILKMGGAVIVTADHGNAEEKIYASSGEKRTKHTANPVPFYIISNDVKNKEPRTDSEIAARYGEVRGVLSDIAPSVLALLGLPKKEEMSGIDLLPKIL